MPADTPLAELEFPGGRSFQVVHADLLKETTDGVVNAADYTVWRNSLGQNVAAGTGADGSGNGMIDLADYNAWKMHFGEHSGSGTGAAIPEPSTLLLAVTGVLMICLWRHAAR